MNENTSIINEIIDIKESLKGKLVIPAHHYQRNEIVQLADFIGDSYKLAKESSKTNSKYILFCGVKFMAESAKILANPSQKVIIPDIMAGCPMADMIDIKTANNIFNKIQNQCKSAVVPVVYMNSYADMKSFCGEKEGSVCTSSNAKKIIEHYLSEGKSIFFFPDFHLGKNTASALNIDDKYIVKVKRDGSMTDEKNSNDAKLFLYDGFCHVHQTFTESDISLLREKYYNINIIVHPECKESIVKLSDSYGSTEQIYKTVKESKAGSIWGIGTEYNFVKRMADEFKDKTIIPLRISPCMNMEKISLAKLLKSLKSIIDFENGRGALEYEVNVNLEYITNSKKSLENMIKIVEN